MMKKEIANFHTEADTKAKEMKEMEEKEKEQKSKLLNQVCTKQIILL